MSYARSAPLTGKGRIGQDGSRAGHGKTSGRHSNTLRVQMRNAAPIMGPVLCAGRSPGWPLSSNSAIVQSPHGSRFSSGALPNRKSGIHFCWKRFIGFRMPSRPSGSVDFPESIAAYSCGGSHGIGPFWVVRTVFPFASRFDSCNERGTNTVLDVPRAMTPRQLHRRACSLITRENQTIGEAG